MSASMKLVAKADVVVENYRPDVKNRLGIDYEACASINPRIVYGSISGFGQTGPYRDRPGYDQVAQGMGGLMSITGLPGQGPVRVGIPIDDLCAGILLAQGILMALLERGQSGEGQWVHTSLLEAQIFMLDFQASRWLQAGEVAKQAGNDHPTGIPTGVFKTSDGHMATVIAVRNVEVNGGRGQVIDLSLLESIFSILGPEAAIYKLSRKVRKRVGSASEGTSPRNVYATSDGGWVAISASTQAMTERLFRAIGRDDMNHNPAFKTNTERVKRRDEVDAIVGGFIKQRTLADAIRFFEEAEVTAAPVYDIGQFLDDPHVQERGIVVDAPDVDMGEVPMHAIVPRLSGTPGPLRYPAPAVGQHNHEIFSRIGYSEERIGALTQKGTI